VFKHEIDTSQSLVKCDFLFHKDIGSLSFKNFVGLLLCNNDHIASFSTRILISFTIEMVSLVVRCTFIDFSIDNLLLFAHFLTITVLALVFVIDLLSLTIAFFARSS